MSSAKDFSARASEIDALIQSLGARLDNLEHVAGIPGDTPSGGLAVEMKGDYAVGDIAALKNDIATAVCTTIHDLFGVDVSSAHATVVAKLEVPQKREFGDIALPCFVFAKQLKGKKPHEVAQALADGLQQKAWPCIGKIVCSPPYVNFFLPISYLSKVVDAICDGGYLASKPKGKLDKVMIEYSQPNTHKAFHVGHMRNAALGDALVRLYDHIGHEVVAVNYFGDEGAHVAKCLWYLNKHYLQKGHALEDAPSEGRGEWLGGMYSKSVEALDLSLFTSLPFPGLVTAKVVSIDKHPDPTAPANWHVVVVQTGPGPDGRHTVVCGGDRYNIGDVVAYAPVGIRFNKIIVAPKDMKGVESSGLMVAYREVGKEAPLTDAERKEAEEKAASGQAKGKGKGKGKKGKQQAGANAIFVLPPDTPVGVLLTELGRLPLDDDINPEIAIPAGAKIEETIKAREKEVRKTLLDMEEKEERITQLWDITKKWSLDEFKQIYAWLGCRFDHDFFESEVGDESKQLVLEERDKGVLIDSDGAIAADLQKYKLGFCILLKSNGTGLYATKDLALAKKKFEQYNIDKSIYVVDAAQTLHFQQVFKVLELMGYEQAKKCFHLAYGLVVLPSGKMSSRKGTVILFSSLKDMLYRQITADFLDKQDDWTDEEKEKSRHAIAVGTIKYGMLSVGPGTDIVFELNAWAAKKGNTGPYLMYAYTRLAKIIRDVPVAAGAKVDYSLMADAERTIMASLNEFWTVVTASATEHNPSLLCTYLYELSKLVSAWYELPGMSVKKAEPNTQATRLRFIYAIAQVLKVGLSLLGIPVLEKM